MIKGISIAVLFTLLGSSPSYAQPDNQDCPEVDLSKSYDILNNPKASQTYKKDEELTSANGAFVAPFDGIHGWYWLNLTAKPIKITLKISGFYESHDYVK